ncbi:UNVERIFIED_CONTAM: hypothetical protein GTU68_063261, partial [Idotea baltica]|nr:hypothetical protein [Idotea baltica]
SKIANEQQPNNWQTIVVDESEDKERLDSFLRRHFPKFSRVKLQRSIAAGDVTVDDQVSKSSARVRTDQTVKLRLPHAAPEGSLPEDIPLDILFEDDSLVAINKPPAMVVHPAKGHWAGTLTAALAFHFQNLSSVGGPTRPGIVHRLDRDTSGVILVAKTDQAHHALSSQFQNRTVKKEYVAIVSPAPDRDNDHIDKPIGAHPYQREKKAVRENHSTSRAAYSVYRVEERFQGFGVVRVKPKTGRTHQIRVHMAHAGYPVLCDKLYSGRSQLTLKDLTRKDNDDQLLLGRQALHAHRIEVTHPVTGQPLIVEAPLPEDMQQTIDTFRRLRPL